MRGKSFARLREEDVLVVNAAIGHRKALIGSQPHTYYVTPHYQDHPYVLVRIAHADETDLATSSLTRGPWLPRSDSRPASSPTSSRTERPRSVVAPHHRGKPRVRRDHRDEPRPV